MFVRVHSQGCGCGGHPSRTDPASITAKLIDGTSDPVINAGSKFRICAEVLHVGMKSL